MKSLEDIIRFYIRPCVAILGGIGNLAALIVLLQRRMRNKTTCIYMAVMSISDLIILLSHEMIHSVWDGRDIPLYVCKIGIFLFYYSLHMSVALLIAMTTEKYLSIRFPLQVSMTVKSFFIHIHT